MNDASLPQKHASPDVQSGSVRQRAKSASQRRTKQKVFDERQTDEERRLLRIEQRAVNKVLSTGAYRTRQMPETEEEEKGLEDESLAQPTLECVRDSNNELFRHVTYTRELVLDADNVSLLTSSFAKNVEKSAQVPPYDAVKVILALKKKCTKRQGQNSFFDWKTLGVQAGVFFDAVPSKVTFAAGKYEDGIAAKERKMKAKKVQDTSEVVRPEQQEDEAKEEKVTVPVADVSVAKLRARINKAYKANIKENPESPELLDPLEVLLDPTSFTKTVENFFNFSFLVKRGHVDVKKGWGIRPVRSEGEAGEHRQAFISINKQIWKDMCAELEARKNAVEVMSDEASAADSSSIEANEIPRATQKFALGTRVEKDFQVNEEVAQTFRGTVVSFEPFEEEDGTKTWGYLIQYDDDDREHMDEAEVAKHVV